MITLASNQAEAVRTARKTYEDAARACRDSGGNPDRDSNVQTLKSAWEAAKVRYTAATGREDTGGILG